jgi:hypothetical protein
MDGPAFQTVDGAFYRVSRLDTWIRSGDELADIELDAEEALTQLEEARGLLLLEGFSGSELKRMQSEMDTSHARTVPTPVTPRSTKSAD